MFPGFFQKKVDSLPALHYFDMFIEVKFSYVFAFDVRNYIVRCLKIGVWFVEVSYGENLQRFHLEVIQRLFLFIYLFLTGREEDGVK